MQLYHYSQTISHANYISIYCELSFYINAFITHYCIRLYNVYTYIYIWYMYIQPSQKLLNHYEVLWKLISTFNDHYLLKISILCCCHLLFVNIITKVLWKLYITGPYYAYSVSHKNHSCPIISAMAVCICAASSGALLTNMQHSSAGAFNSVPMVQWQRVGLQSELSRFESWLGQEFL